MIRMDQDFETTRVCETLCAHELAEWRALVNSIRLTASDERAHTLFHSPEGFET